MSTLRESQTLADTAPIPSGSEAIGHLRRRESATEAMLRQIDDKLSRLDSARTERANALNRIRHELVLALKGKQAVPVSNERRAAQ